MNSSHGTTIVLMAVTDISLSTIKIVNAHNYLVYNYNHDEVQTMDSVIGTDNTFTSSFVGNDININLEAFSPIQLLNSAVTIAHYNKFYHAVVQANVIKWLGIDTFTTTAVATICKLVETYPHNLVLIIAFYSKPLLALLTWVQKPMLRW